MNFSNFLRSIGICFAGISSFAFDSPVIAATSNNCVNVIVDKVWSGTTVGPAAISTPDAIFVVYYNQYRYMTAAKIDLSTCHVETKQLSSQFGGYDTHNYITMTFDKSNMLHISGNMHNVPLVYFRATKPFDISSLTQSSMSGRYESSVTYPVFFFIKSNMYFMYRDGMSGNGLTYINKYLELSDIGAVAKGRMNNPKNQRRNGTWIKHVSNSIFSDKGKLSGKSTNVSAYPSALTLGPDDNYHIAVDWRATGDVSSNYAISYVKTPDFVKWYDASGRPVALPISSDTTSALVASIGMNKGLVNNVRVSFTASGKPVVLYTKYVDTAEGMRNGIYAAKFDGEKWVSILLAKSTNLTQISGIGSLSNLPYFTQLTLYGPVATMAYRFYNEPLTSLNLDSETLLPTGEKPVLQPVRKVSPSPVTPLMGLETDANAAIRLAGYQNRGGPLLSLRWRSLPANNDRPFKCPPNAAAYCNPSPSDLVLDTLWPK